MSNPAKVLRQQIRQVVIDLLPEVLKKEIVSDVEIRLRKEIHSRLDEIDRRQKDLHSYLIRNSSPLKADK